MCVVLCLANTEDVLYRVSGQLRSRLDFIQIDFQRTNDLTRTYVLRMKISFYIFAREREFVCLCVCVFVCKAELRCKNKLTSTDRFFEVSKTSVISLL